jgi:predicted metalloprotease
MRWEPGERSPNLEDRRDEAPAGGRGPGLPGGIRIGLGGAVVLLVLSVVTGQNFFVLLDPGPGVDVGPGGTATQYQPSPEEERLVDFVSFVLDDVQTTWTRELPQAGREYQDAKLVLFNGAVRSGCGFAESAMGPFYCPADRRVYIDLGFYRELKTRFGAPGDFAQAYVIAHEVGHHVQNLLGISDRIQERRRARPDQSAALSVRLELQADCLAGVWAHSTAQRELLEQGDVEEGIGAAAAVGDDRIQRQAGARVNPESWTHGSSQQRVAWFRQGLTTGRVQACDTFNTRLPADRAS